MKKIIILLLVIIISWVANSLNETSPFKSGQVVGIARADLSAYMLEISEHISLAQRPVETFNFPIEIGETGPSESLYSGPKQYPFYCMSVPSELGQPLVDNQRGEGIKVYAVDSRGRETDRVIGYSRDCLLATQVNYFYRNKRDGQIKRYSLVNRPGNELVGKISIDNKTVDEIYRVEHGTINRFIYIIAMLADPDKGRLDQSRWNKRLIYQFQGGSGIGFRQGKESGSHMINKRIEQLRLGYAVITSSANKTSYTYNMLLAEDTAMRVKRQFVSLYGQPKYTVGIGGSGGGLAQYLLAQNGTDLLDALMPLYSYPDMVTQTIYALDCDLLNSFYNYRSDDPELFNDWTLRSAIEGMNARNSHSQKAGFLTPVNQIFAGRWPNIPEGNSECINGWFGLSTFINNPRQGFLRPYFADNVIDQVNWSYWEDLNGLYGRNSNGFAKTTWDNVGVQYGLEALKDKKIDLSTFIDLNWKIGGWRSQPLLKAENIQTLPLIKVPLWLSLWGRHNITEPKNGVAPRHQADLVAIDRAYRSGQVFVGKLRLPTLDIRHYLENELDMHHISASFNTRLRIEQRQGSAAHQAIWVSHKDFDPVVMGFRTMDQWMLSLLKDPNRDVVKAKPSSAGDSCFDRNGEIIASGDDVWDGRWNGKQTGHCSEVYPMYSNSRIAAGAPWEASIFKCYLQSIEQAVSNGVYGDIDVSTSIELLKATFPDGVCDYRRGDAGRPLMKGI